MPPKKKTANRKVSGGYGLDDETENLPSDPTFGSRPVPGPPPNNPYEIKYGLQYEVTDSPSGPSPLVPALQKALQSADDEVPLITKIRSILNSPTKPPLSTNTPPPPPPLLLGTTPTTPIEPKIDNSDEYEKVNPSEQAIAVALQYYFGDDYYDQLMPLNFKQRIELIADKLDATRTEYIKNVLALHSDKTGNDPKKNAEFIKKVSIRSTLKDYLNILTELSQSQSAGGKPKKLSLENTTVKELKKKAASKNISLKGITLKADIIKKMRGRR